MATLFYKLSKLVRLCTVPLYRSALMRHGVAAGIEHDRILSMLSGLEPALTEILDVGANAGQFSLAARRWFPDARILAFEPLSSPADRYRAAFSDDKRAHLFQVAIGPVRTELEMHVSKAIDSSSLLPIGAQQVVLFPGTEEARTERVQVMSLSDALHAVTAPRRALLKIDVQGYELEVLRGSESLLASIGAIYVECSFVELYKGQPLAHEVIDWLHQRGFVLARIGQPLLDSRGLSIQADFLFRRPADGRQS